MPGEAGRGAACAGYLHNICIRESKIAVEARPHGNLGRHRRTHSAGTEMFWRIVDGDLGVRAVAELVGNEGGVVSGVFNLESSGVEASDWRPRHDKHYHEA